MNIVERVRNIIIHPAGEWEVIKQEETEISNLFGQYAAVIAAVPAAAGFIAMVLFGYRTPVGWMRIGIGHAFSYAVIKYVFSLIGVYAGGHAVNFLAPKFGSEKNISQALKLVIYSVTPAWIAGVFRLIPFLGIFQFLAYIYAAYLIYLGLSGSVMNTPKDKILSYMLVSLLSLIGIMIVMAVIMSSFFAAGAAF